MATILWNVNNPTGSNVTVGGHTVDAGQSAQLTLDDDLAQQFQAAGCEMTQVASGALSQGFIAGQ